MIMQFFNKLVQSDSQQPVADSNRYEYGKEDSESEEQKNPNMLSVPKRLHEP